MNLANPIRNRAGLANNADEAVLAAIAAISAGGRIRCAGIDAPLLWTVSGSSRTTSPATINALLRYEGRYVRNELRVDIATLLTRAQELLLTPPKSAVEYSNLSNLRDNRLPTNCQSEAINLYALWIRESPARDWKCVYIGQRKQKQAWSRVRQHLFHTPKGTQSKLALLGVMLQEGCQVGVTGVYVDPDSIRLAVEEELIYRNTTTATSLPWNNKGRKVSLTAPKKRNPELTDVKLDAG